tara:strand:- start:10662 stop:12005 length:1344 start_codon:yes stop_codon:yes gene_type:complete
MSNTGFVQAERLHFFLVASQVLILLYYFAINILNIGEQGVGILYALGFFILSGLIGLRLIVIRRLYFRLSFLLLLLLVILVTVRIVFDRAEIAFLKETLIGSTGGVIFFFLMGVALSFSLLELLRLSTRRPARVAMLGYFLLLAVSVFYGYLAIELKERLRDDIFLIKMEGASYQRPGNFLTIVFLLYSVLFFIVMLVKEYNKLKTPFSFAMPLIYLASTCVAAFSAQMIGSNNSFLMISSIGVITLVSYSVKSVSLRYPGSRRQVTDRVLSYSVIRSLFFRGAIVVGGIFLFLVVIVNWADFDIKQMRFFGFGDSENDSVSSRLSIFKGNFILHYSDSPLWGNYNIDVESTGAGTYVHSALGYSLTHTGVVGFIVLLTMIVLVIRDLVSSSVIFDGSLSFQLKSVRMLFLFLFLVVFVVASLATVMTWSVLWFSLGFLTLMVYFKK